MKSLTKILKNVYLKKIWFSPLFALFKDNKHLPNRSFPIRLLDCYSLLHCAQGPRLSNGSSSNYCNHQPVNTEVVSSIQTLLVTVLVFPSEVSGFLLALQIPQPIQSCHEISQKRCLKVTLKTYKIKIIILRLRRSTECVVDELNDDVYNI